MYLVYMSENKKTKILLCAGKQENNLRKQKTIEIMKTRISQLAAVTFFALFVLVGNVNAKGNESFASSHETENTLEIEDWMINENCWSTGGSFDLSLAADAILEVEGWMTSENTWKAENKIDLETETEQELAFEPWMTDENIWNW